MQFWTKTQQVPGLNFCQVKIPGVIADLVKSLNYTSKKDPVPKQGNMQAIDSPGQILLT
jgi:hypothetical protein